MSSGDATRKRRLPSKEAITTAVSTGSLASTSLEGVLPHAVHSGVNIVLGTMSTILAGTTWIKQRRDKKREDRPED